MSDTISLQVVRETKNLSKFLATVPVQDLVDTLRQVSAFAIQGQINLGNKPSNVFVDSGGEGSIANAKRRVRAVFGDTVQIKAALHEAFEVLKHLTRFETGRAQASYMLSINGVIVGDESSVDREAAKMTAKDYAVVFGPTVKYGRKLYTRPATGDTAPKTRLIHKSRTTYRTNEKGKKVRTTIKYANTFRESIGRAAQRILQRKYRSLTIREFWANTRFFEGVGKNSSTPGLLIRFKATGSRKGL